MSNGGGGVLHESLKRGVADTCVYVTRPGESTRKMVTVKPGDSWQIFLQHVGARLDMTVARVFNSHDEITCTADLVQGDILFVKTISADEDDADGALALSGQALRTVNWIRVTRLLLLQCVEGYIVTEVLSKTKYRETLKARRTVDGLRVVIKRFVGRPGVGMDTLRSCIPGCWSIRHPHFASLLDIGHTHDLRRPMGSAGAFRRAKKSGSMQVMTMVTELQESSLDRVLAEHVKLQKSISEDQLVAWLSQILKVLQYLHTELRVVHRNLKLSNLLVNAGGHVLLSDMALPKVDPGVTAYHMRHTCRNCCCVNKGADSSHISPEAIQSGCTSEKDDIWALGCVLTELVTFKMTSERGAGEIFGQSQGTVAQAVAEVMIKNAKMGKLCRVLLEIDPAKRPTSSEVLLKYMRNFSCLTVFESRQLSITERHNVNSLAKSNDIPTLISAILKDGVFEACEAAAARLHEILYFEPTKRVSMKEVYATPFGRQSGLESLCHCATRGSPLAQQRAASAIRNALLDDDVENCIGMEEIRALTAAVIMGTPQTQLNAAAALANACATRKESRDYLHSVGGMGALAALISSCTSETMTSTSILNSAITEAASAVRNACIGHAANREAFMKSRGVTTFVSVLNCDSPVPSSLREKHFAMQEQVVGALRNVCNQHTRNCMHFAECDGVSSMMRLLSSPSDIVQEEVVGLIRNACVGYYGNKDHMTQCGAFWSFSQMMNDPTLSVAVRDGIISTVRYASVGHEVNQQAAGEAGLIRALVAVLHALNTGHLRSLHAVLDEGDMRVKTESAACLRILCDESESNSAEMVKCHGIPALLEVLATGHTAAKEEAIAALANACCAHSKNLDFVNEKARRELQEVIAKSSSVSAECKLFAKSVLIAWESSRQKRNPNLSTQEGIKASKTSWCPKVSWVGTEDMRVSLSNVSIVSDKPASRNFNTIAKLPKISGHKFEHKTVAGMAKAEKEDGWRWPECKTKVFDSPVQITAVQPMGRYRVVKHGLDN